MIGEKMPLKAKRTSVAKVAVRKAAWKTPTTPAGWKTPRTSIAVQLLAYWVARETLMGMETPNRALVSNLGLVRTSSSGGKSLLRK